MYVVLKEDHKDVENNTGWVWYAGQIGEVRVSTSEDWDNLSPEKRLVVSFVGYEDAKERDRIRKQTKGEGANLVPWSSYIPRSKLKAFEYIDWNTKSYSDEVEVIYDPRPVYKGHKLKEGLEAFRGQKITVTRQWLMDKDDHYDGEWALSSPTSAREVFNLLGVSWIPSGDVRPAIPEGTRHEEQTK